MTGICCGGSTACGSGVISFFGSVGSETNQTKFGESSDCCGWLTSPEVLPTLLHPSQQQAREQRGSKASRAEASREERIAKGEPIVPCASCVFLRLVITRDRVTTITHFDLTLINFSAGTVEFSTDPLPAFLADPHDQV